MKVVKVFLLCLALKIALLFYYVSAAEGFRPLPQKVLNDH